MGYPRVPTIVTELGTERLCRGCGEFWPVDEAFWFFDKRGQVLGRCRACWSERSRDETGRKRMPPMQVVA